MIRKFNTRMLSVALVSLLTSSATLAAEEFVFGNDSGKYFSDSGDYYVTASAFSSTGEVVGDDLIETAALKIFGTYLGDQNNNPGDNSGNFGQHGIDNRSSLTTSDPDYDLDRDSTGSGNGDKDFVLFQAFDKNDNAVSLSLLSFSIGYGWDGTGSRDNKADMQVLAFNPTSSTDATKIVTPNTLIGSTIPKLTDSNSGWESEKIDDVPINTETAVNNFTAPSHSWIVATNLDYNYDSSKLRNLIFDTPTPGGGSPIPLPGSLLLLAAGLPLFRRFRRQMAN